MGETPTPPPPSRGTPPPPHLGDMYMSGCCIILSGFKVNKRDI